MFAIIGPTASGKTDLGIQLGKRLKMAILSLDSMAVYREVDILSAKPTLEEREGVPHFGIDLVYPDTPFDVIQFFQVVEQVIEEWEDRFIIVGGSSFYLKALISGISPFPKIEPEIAYEARRRSGKKGWKELAKIDPLFCQRITPTDRYRIARGWEIYLATGLAPTDYFRQNPPRSPFPYQFPIYEIRVDRARLREQIWKRTTQMFQKGLVDEVAYLEWKYRNRQLPALKGIGAREVLDYFNGKFELDKCREQVALHTAQLAKRQIIFNRTQFPDRIEEPLPKLFYTILNRERIKKD